MKRISLAAVTLLLSSTALAHPDHAGQAFSLAHYFTGSHLAMGLAGLVLLALGLVKLVRALRNH